jgi:hypothetical protein
MHWALKDVPSSLDATLRVRLLHVLEDIERYGATVAPKLEPFNVANALRPPGHNRTFYVPLEGGGYIGIKGTEVALGEQLRLLSASGLPRALRPSGQTAVDFFPTIEHKIPLALTIPEAHAEVHISEVLYRRYCTTYGETPHLPLPLAIIQWPQNIVDSFWTTISPLLSDFARDICTRLLRDGVCCYLYYYPVAPFPRVRHLAETLKNRHDRLHALAQLGQPVEVIQRWVTLFVRILAMGYLPATPSRAVTGQAVQAQNVVVGGGFLDLDSVRAIEDIPSESELAESLAASIVHMSATIACYLFEAANEHPSPTNSLDILSTHFFQALLVKTIERETRVSQCVFHPRLRALPPFSASLDDWLLLADAAQNEPRISTLTAYLGGSSTA